MAEHFDDLDRDIPDYVNDRYGGVSLALLGFAIVLILLLIIAVVQAA